MLIENINFYIFFILKSLGIYNVMQLNSDFLNAATFLKI